jgi:hypothetical protein
LKHAVLARWRFISPVVIDMVYTIPTIASHPTLDTRIRLSISETRQSICDS